MITILMYPLTTCSLSLFLSPEVGSCSTNQVHIIFPIGLSIIGTQPLLSSRESPQGQFIMNLNATHYPDKAEAVARQWLPYWLDDSYIALTGKHSHSSYLVDWTDRSSCIHKLL